MDQHVIFKRGSNKNLENLPKETGSIILAIDEDSQQAEMYYDHIGDSRLQISSKVDQQYDENSPRAQSGKAIAEALSGIESGSGGTIVVDQSFNPQSSHAQSGKAVADATNRILKYLTFTINNNAITITDCDVNIEGFYTIPAYIGNYPVEKIGQYAFSQCSKLQGIELPNSIIMIDYGAFFNCNSLTNIVLPESIKQIKTQAFYNCEKLSEVYYLGTQQDWENIELGTNNTLLTDAKIYYNQALATKQFVLDHQGGGSGTNIELDETYDYTSDNITSSKGLAPIFLERIMVWQPGQSYQENQIVIANYTSNNSTQSGFYKCKLAHISSNDFNDDYNRWIVIANANIQSKNSTYANYAFMDYSGNEIATTYATKGQVNSKQDTLVSGTTIKTINDQSLLGEGNIEIVLSDDEIDQSYDSTSTRPQSGVAVAEAFSNLTDEAIKHSSTEDTIADLFNIYVLSFNYENNLAFNTTEIVIKYDGVSSLLDHGMLGSFVLG